MSGSINAVLRPLLEHAGQEALQRFRHVRARHKSDGSPVTEADLLAEQILVEGIERAFPQDSIRSEEGMGHEGGRREWMVDPLDGTGAFLEGLAHWGPTVGLLEDDVPLFGALYWPRTGDYLFAEAGRAWWDDEALSTLDTAQPNRRSILYIPSRLHAYVRLDWPGKARNLGSIAAHLALVASGGATAALIPGGWKPWDVVCGLALLNCVGGEARTFDGTPLSVRQHHGEAFVAGNPAAVEWLRKPDRLRFFTDS